MSAMRRSSEGAPDVLSSSAARSRPNDRASVPPAAKYRQLALSGHTLQRGSDAQIPLFRTRTHRWRTIRPSRQRFPLRRRWFANPLGQFRVRTLLLAFFASCIEESKTRQEAQLVGRERGRGRIVAARVAPAFEQWRQALPGFRTHGLLNRLIKCLGLAFQFHELTLRPDCQKSTALLECIS